MRGKVAKRLRKKAYQLSEDSDQDLPVRIYKKLKKFWKALPEPMKAKRTNFKEV